MAATMKRAAAAAVVVVLAAASAAHGAEVRSKGATISQVVDMLKGLLEKSQADGLNERSLYAKYKCYCDDNDKKKTESIEENTKKIEFLTEKIAGLKSSNGALSTEVAELKAAMEESKKMQEQAQSIRDKENEEFKETNQDLRKAIEQLNLAIKTLSDIGADQTMGASAAHEKFMANYKSGSLVILKQSVSQALVAADAVLSPEQKSLKAKIMLQLDAPFTGNYASQAGEIVGILKNMRDTFKSNRASAIDAEKKAAEAHKKFMETQGDAYDKMSENFDEKQGKMGTNDGSLEKKTTALKTAEEQVADDEDFLAELKDMCEEKAKDYEKRKMFRANEEAAIAKAVSILASDRSASAFGKVKAGSGEAVSFVQMAKVRRHLMAAPVDPLRQEVTSELKEAAHSDKSRRLARVAALLSISKNPFSVIMKEIGKMLELIDKESEQDETHFKWCNKERSTNNERIEQKNATIEGIEGDITQLEDDIDNPETGFKAMIEKKEGDLDTNIKAQTDETDTRRTENAQYQETVANIVQSENLLSQAVEVLTKYYEDLKNVQIGLVQKKASPEPPSSWEGDFEGQTSGGKEVISLLESILEDSHTEQMTVHDNEATAQHDYEDSMKKLTDDEKDLREEIVELQKDLADAKQDLEGKREDLHQTILDRRAIFRYLESIAPPCDFITKNIEDREKFRGLEKKALRKAMRKLKGTPAFAKAQAADLKEKRGKCAPACEAEASHVDCKACMADVSVPGYCAGHPGTPGC